MAVSVVDPDEILIREHLGGERDAFDVLYRRYFPRLVRFCTRLTKNGATAEDIAQETLVRAHGHLEGFDLGRPVWPWLKTIAKNLIVDHARTNGRELPVEDSAVDSVHIQHGWNDEREVLVQALSKLPPRQRTAVALRYIEDWDGPQVAEHLGLSGLAFRQILHRARRKLQTEYRKIAEPAWGAILIPLNWLRRFTHGAGLRVRRVTEHPESIRAVASVAAINLVVATAAVFGGAGRGAPPSVVQSAPPNHPVAAHGMRHPVHALEMAGGHQAEEGSGTSRPPTAPSSAHEMNQEAGSLATRAEARGNAVAQRLGDPNADVDQPEDAQITSVVYSPRESDGTVYAAGVASCEAPHCPPVLFRSADAGATWVRLPAVGFDGNQLLLPPAFGSGDDRIFAMGPVGLEVSEDGGSSFNPAAPGGVAVGTGSSAISPGFNTGDPTILIGSETLMQYRDDVKAVGPTRPIPGRGPLHPAFSPSYQDDGLLLVGGLQTSGVQWSPTVFSCRGDVCSGSPLAVSTSETPEVRPAPDLAVNGLVYAFVSTALFVSSDQGASFSQIATPWDLPIRDVAPLEDGRLFTAVRSGAPGASGELYLSPDRGATWQLVDSPLLAAGVSSVQASGSHVIAALHAGGIACSADGGATWAARCSADGRL